VIYVGIDDTDVRDSPGTNLLARRIVHELAPRHRAILAVRHQLLFDPRVPYTSKNSAASLLFEPGDDPSPRDLAARIRAVMRREHVDGSDPGLCVTGQVAAEVAEFGRRCQQEVVDQPTARGLARRHGIYLEGLSGTEDGVIGALAAVGLAAGGNDGRVVQIALFPDDLSGPQQPELLHARGVDAILRADSGEEVLRGTIDVGKHLRPNYRGGRVVLYVEPAPQDAPGQVVWRAVRRA